MTLGGIGSIAPLVLPGQRRRDLDHFRIFGLQVHLAAVPAVVAGGGRFLHLPGLVEILGELIGDGRHRTDRKASLRKLASKREVAFGPQLD